MFWVNLLPAAIALAIIGMFFFDKPDNDWLTIGAFVFLCTGLAAQVIYFLQFNFKKHANNRNLWLYSVIYNALCIIAWIAEIITVPFTGISILILYPIAFFYLSYSAYQQLKPGNQSL
ncbi:hypothetical protein BDD43_1908 [Mucilaginibacter gracilis]|uniref:Uncharacterized protein n=1 Tax=Mucilaginibacter gracilis TaxID=423350 RepID=A0A495IYV6_9SPHI|nr:hypothetical protein BDD43_1908 [Mucilaginibacter gracilis]